jgi:catechol 2,3-dioxygenase-like lactoylglutathione lyase family enzyme
MARFYGEVLGLPVVSRVEGRFVFMRCGPGMLLVFDPGATLDPAGTLPPHGTEGPAHVALAVAPGDLDAWRQHLEAAGVAVEHEATWGEDDAGEDDAGGAAGRSLYVRDPAGHSVELAPAAIWPLAGSPLHGRTPDAEEEMSAREAPGREAPGRDAALRALRPRLDLDASAARPVETFQLETLRPVLKLQNPLILKVVARYLVKYHTGFARMSRTDQQATVRNLLKQDRRLKRTLFGLIAGQFTADEFDVYLAHQGEMRRRLVELLIKRVQDQLEALPLDTV